MLVLGKAVNRLSGLGRGSCPVSYVIYGHRRAKKLASPNRGIFITWEMRDEP